MKIVLSLAFLALVAVTVKSAAVDGEAHVCACPLIYKPVCGADGKTYSNDCSAKCAEQEVSCENACPCQAVEPKVQEPHLCACPFILLPVCYKGVTYSNDCVAKCAGAPATEIQQGKCPTSA